MSDIGVKEYCSTKEAALRLGLSLGTVQQMVENGVLEGWKTTGGHRRILVSSVDRFLTRSATGTTTPARRASERLRIVVAEDDAVLQSLYARSMKAWSMPIEPQILSNGFDALIEVGRNPPDLLITDLRMPGMDGFEMIRRIRESDVTRDIDIVAISGLSPEEVAENGGLPADVTLYGKPVPFTELRGYVQAMLSRKLRARAS